MNLRKGGYLMTMTVLQTINLQKKAVLYCFNDTKRHDCLTCPAHHTRDGICCFGNQHNPADVECKMCHYEVDCALASKLRPTTAVEVTH
jgi:hypothetical protein